MEENDQGYNFNLKDLEKRAWKSTFQDGLWDMYLGMLMLGISMSTFSLNIPFFPEIINRLSLLIIIDSLAVIVLTIGKKCVTVPRMGLVKFGKKRKRRERKLKIVMGVLVGLTTISVIFTALGFLQLVSIPSPLMMLFIGIFGIAFPFCVIAYFLQFTRMYWYGIFGGLLLFLAEILYILIGEPWNFLLTFTPLSIIIISIGVYYLINFLKKYPKPRKVRKDNRKR